MINPTFIGFEENLVIGQFSFSLFPLVTIRAVNLPERTETGLITGPDKTAWAVHSCNSWLRSFNVDDLLLNKIN